MMHFFELKLQFYENRNFSQEYNFQLEKVKTIKNLNNFDFLILINLILLYMLNLCKHSIKIFQYYK